MPLIIHVELPNKFKFMIEFRSIKIVQQNLSITVSNQEK